MAQPLKKKEVKKEAFNIKDLKAKIGIATETIGSSNADKPMQWLIMPEGFREALKLNIPQNYVTLICGHSNSGKSTIINHAIVAAQKQDLIPVIYDTENNFDFTYAIDMGMDATPVYGDVEVEKVNEETGEIEVVTENRIVEYEGNFLYFNNEILAKLYGTRDYSTGKDTAKPRKVAVIEDVATSINELLNMQDEGQINKGLVIILDSVGSIGCYKAYKSATNNAMWDAAAISVAFNGIVNDRIPRSRKVTSPYNNTFIAVNKVWLDSMSNPMPGAPPSLSLKGGTSLYYSARLIILAGKQLKSGVKRLTAVAKGLTYNYGLETSLKVLKNQLPNPYSVSYEGNVVCTPHGIIPPDKQSLEEYRKKHVSEILKNLNKMNSDNKEEIIATDIEFVEEEDVSVE